MSPRKSSMPWISDRIAYLLLPSSSTLSIRPIAIPDTGFLIGTPASIRARQEPQVDAIEDDPFEDRTSDTTLIAYGNSSSLGITGRSALSASAPWPISLLPGLRGGFGSPVEYPGKLYWCMYLLVVLSMSMLSKSCASDRGASVATDRTWVWPLLNSPVPCALGRNPVSENRGLISLSFLLSGLTPSSRIMDLTCSFLIAYRTSPTSLSLSSKISAKCSWVSVSTLSIFSRRSSLSNVFIASIILSVA